MQYFTDPKRLALALPFVDTDLSVAPELSAGTCYVEPVEATININRTNLPDSPPLSHVQISNLMSTNGSL